MNDNEYIEEINGFTICNPNHTSFSIEPWYISSGLTLTIDGVTNHGRHFEIIYSGENVSVSFNIIEDRDAVWT